VFTSADVILAFFLKQRKKKLKRPEKEGYPLKNQRKMKLVNLTLSHTFAFVQIAIIPGKRIKT